MVDPSTPSGLVPATDAAALLGVKRETLYAYVSRGVLTSHRVAGTRGSWFDPAELDALVKRGRGRGSGSRPGVDMESAVTLIADGGFWYRGLDPLALALEAGYERIAELLWTGTLPDHEVRWPADRTAADRARSAVADVPSATPLADRLRIVVPVLGAHDPMRFDLRPAQVADLARRLLPTALDALGPGDGPAAPTMAERVAGFLDPDPGIDPDVVVRAVDVAMGLLADHELAASTTAVRIAASFKAEPYAATTAGLAAMAGTFHGAASVLAADLLPEVVAAGDAGAVVGTWLARGDRLPGFGQPVYPAGDPRAPTLLRLAADLGGDPAVLEAAAAVIALAVDRALPPPNVDFASATLFTSLGCGRHAGESVFTVARMAGWLAHAMEEYAQRSALRLRALYTGPRPGEPRNRP